jgi:ATP-binding cassette, subfamily C, bacterial
MPHDPMRRLLRHLMRAFGAAAVVTLFVNLATLIVPIYDMILYDRILQSRNMDSLTVLSVSCALGLVIFGVLEFVRNCLYLVMGDRVARRLNIPTLAAAIAKTLDGQASAAAQAMRDLNDLRGFVTSQAAAIPLDLLWTPALLAVLFLLHPLYFAFGLGSAALLFAISVATDLATRKRLIEANQASTGAINQLAQVLRNTDLLDGMGMLPAVARRWQRRQERIGFELDRATRHGKAFAAVARTCRLTMQGGIIALGVILVIRREASPGSMMGANLIVAKLLLPFDQLVTGWRQWMFALAALRRVRQLHAQAPRRAAPAAAAALASVPALALAPTAPSGLVVDRLAFTPPGGMHPVLDDVSFDVRPGEVLAIVGPSAAGKSTLARLMVGLFAPTAGSVRLDGIEVTVWDRTAFGQAVGYVPQSVALLDGTVFDNIARMTEADPQAVVEAATQAGIHDMIGFLPQGYATRIGGTGHALSGGQRQRIALARALFGAPRFLVLDEPNANLDHLGEQALAETIATLRLRKTGVVLVTHRPALLEVADTLLVLKQGRVDRYDPTEQREAVALPAEPVLLGRAVP